MRYGAQLQEKMDRVALAFGGEVQPILAAPQIFRYRNKMEFTFSENRAGARYLGLMIAQAEPYVYKHARMSSVPSLVFGAFAKHSRLVGTIGLERISSNQR
jgi:tRNA/tmRNA/rRNA uracil-C5-methylase (TrmA/RlmC/RlmD family)